MGDGVGLIRDLLSLRERRETGVLEVAHGGLRAFVYVDRGEPVFAEHGTLGDTLGRLLLRLGAITPEQYGAIIRVMTSQLVENEQMRFGEVAVELGFLTHEQMLDALAAQVRQKILTCLEWEDPERVFVPGADTLEGLARFPCDVDGLVFDAVRALHDEARVASIVAPQLERYPSLAWPLPELERRLRLSSQERRWVRLARGRDTLRALLGSPPADPSTLCLAATLTLLGALSFAGEPLAARSVEPPAPRPVAPTRAISRLARDLRGRAGAAASPSPPPVAASPRPEPQRAQEAEARDRRLAAELAMRAGLSHMAAAAWREALDELRRARELDADSTEYGLYVAWAEREASPDAGGEARTAELLRAAVVERKRDPHFGFAYYVIGAIRMEEGDFAKAEPALKKAIELDPQIRDAERRLRLLHMRAKKKR